MIVAWAALTNMYGVFVYCMGNWKLQMSNVESAGMSKQIQRHFCLLIKCTLSLSLYLCFFSRNNDCVLLCFLLTIYSELLLHVTYQTQHRCSVYQTPANGTRISLIVSLPHSTLAFYVARCYCCSCGRCYCCHWVFFSIIWTTMFLLSWWLAIQLRN